MIHSRKNTAVKKPQKTRISSEELYQKANYAEIFCLMRSFTYPSSMIFIDTTSDNVMIDNLVMDNVHFSTVVYSDISCEQYFYPNNAAIMSFDNDIYLSNVKVESFQSNFLFMVGGSLYAGFKKHEFHFCKLKKPQKT